MTELLFYDLKNMAGLVPGLAAQICRELGRRIVAGSIREGELIEDETTLATRFGVSKSVIREAAKLLVSKGMLDIRRGSGTRVRHRESWMLLDDDVLAWHQSVNPRPDFLKQLMDIRQLMEPKAAAWAAEFGSRAAHEEIESSQLRMEKRQRSVEDFVVADALFHRSILRATKNEVLIAMEGVIFSALLGSIKLTNADPRENEKSIPFHREVMEAVLERDAEKAEMKMKELLIEANERLLTSIEGDRIIPSETNSAEI